MLQRLRTLLIVLALGPPGSEDLEDDGLQIGSPVALLWNAMAVILIAVLVGKWIGCR